MQRFESESGSARSKKRARKKSRSGRPSEEISEDPDEEEVDDEINGKTKKRKVERVGIARARNAASGSGTSSMQDMVKEFFQLQQRMEMEWREMMERRAQERQMSELEWRQKLEKAERERLVVEQAWREREEERRMRDESRAEKRDALLTDLLNRLINQTNS